MANAIHFSKTSEGGGSTHGVGLGDLRVVILCDEDGAWYAQGLDIDYLAQGSSLEDAQRAFETGLQRTIALHLEENGNLTELLVPADETVWREVYAKASIEEFTHTQVSIHNLDIPCAEDAWYTNDRASRPVAKQRGTSSLPFKGIDYMTKCAA